MAKLYTGSDCDGAGEPGMFVPSVGLVGAAATAAVQAQMGPPTYSAGSLAAIDTIADMNDTSHAAVSETMDPLWQDCQQLHDLIESLRGKATTFCSDGTACPLPASSSDNFIFVDDDFTVGPDTNAGLLVVTGSLTMHGNFGWDGIIFAVGEGNVSRSGGGNGTISGGFLVADIAGPDNSYGNSDDCSGGFGSPDWDTSGGGDSRVTFCAANLAAALPHDVYRIVEFTQR
jgi:hypothetical protein